MARHASPLETQQLKGQTKEHPGRFPSFVPKSEQELGDCPDWLTGTAAHVWAEMVWAAPKGILTGNDRELLATTCELVALRRSKGVDALPAAKIALMIACLARFGCSPSDRRALGTNEPPPGANEFADFVDS